VSAVRGSLFVASTGTVAAVVVGAGVVAVLLLSGMGHALARDIGLRELRGAVLGSVRVGEVSGSLWRTVELRDVELDDSDGRLVLAASRVRASYSVLDLLRGRIALRSVLVSRPIVRLVQDSQGVWNVARLFRVDRPDAAPAGRRPLVDLRDVRVADGTLVVRPFGRAARPVQITGLDLELRRLRASHPESTAVIAEVRHMSLRTDDPPLRVRRASGQVVVDGDSVHAALDVLELPGSLLNVHGVVRTGGPRVSFEFSANAQRLRFQDISWLSPALPAEGGGSLVIQGTQRADGTSDWEVRGADLRSGESRLAGSLALAFGGGGTRAVRVSGLDVVAEQMDLALLAPLLPSLPLRGRASGSVVGSGPLGRMDVDLDLAFSDAAVPGRPVSYVLGDGVLALGGRDGLRFERFSLRRADLSLATVERLAPAVNLHGRALAAGTLDGPWTDATFEGSLTHRDGEGPTSTVRGSVHLTLADTTLIAADLDVDSLSFDVLARSYAGLPLRGSVAGHVRLEGPVTGMVVEASLAGPAGAVAGNGVVGASDSAASIRVEGRFEGVDLAPHFGWAPATSLSGTCAADVRVPTADTLAPATGTLRVALDRSKAAGVTFRRAALGLTLGEDAIRLDTLFAEHESGGLDAVGAVGRPGGRPGQIVFAVRADTLASFAPLARWLRQRSGDTAVAALDLDGAGRLEGRLVGTLSEWELRGELHLPGFSYGSLGARGLRAEGALIRGAGGDLLRIEGEADSLRAAGLRSAAVRVSAAGPSSGVAARVEAALPLDASLRAALVMGYDSGAFQTRLDSAVIGLPWATWTLQAPAVVGVTRDSIAVGAVDLRSGAGGRVRAAGSLPVRGVGDFRLAADSVPLADLFALAQRDTAGVGGWLSVSLRVAGAASSPSMQAWVSLADGRFTDFRTPLVDGLLAYSDRRLTYKGGLWRETERVLGASGSLPLDLSLGAVEHRQLPGRLEIRVNADSADLSALDAFTTLVTGVRGQLTADVAVSGTWNEPVLSGRAVVSGGAVTLPSLSQRWEGIGLRLETDGNRIRVAEARLRSGGTLDVGGDIVLEGLTRPILHLTLDAVGFQALNRRDFAGLTATGRLRLEGPFLGAVLTGQLTVDEGYLSFADLVEKRIVNLDDPEFRTVVDTNLARAAELGPSVENVFLDSLRIDGLRVAMGSAFWLRSREASIQLAGDLTVTKTAESVLNQYRLDGTLSAVRGSYRLVLGAVSREFQVARGEVRFFGTPDLNPELDIAAERRVRTVRGSDLTVRVLIGGTLLEPRLSLESDQRPPLAETEVVSYLMFGRPSFDLVSGGTGGQSESAVWQGAVAGVASLAAGQLEQTLVSGLGLPLDYIAIRPGFGAEMLSVTQVEAGSQIGERTFLTLNAPLCEMRRGITPQLLGASLEYRISRRWLLEASVEPLLQECRALGVAPRPSTPYQIGVDLFWQRGMR